MTVVGFTVRFHTGFRVGAAYGRDGVDVAADYRDPLPADHLKGLMRAAAREVLHLDERQVGEVFGDLVTPCAWSWSSANPLEPSIADGGGDAVGEGAADRGWRFTVRHRVKVDPHSHSATKDHLVVAEQVWAPAARFAVTLRGVLPPDRVAGQVLVLRAAGAAVHGLGGWRRRGLGWVGVRPDEPISDADLAALTTLRTVEPGPGVTR